MIYYLKGIVAEKHEDEIILDVHDVGYSLLVSHPDDYVIGKEYLIYTYDVVREDEEYLIGFSSKEEKDIFMMLIKVKGLGPKIVINALKDVTPEMVTSAIATNNVAFLKKLPGIGGKAAAQIILDLKGELAPSGASLDPTEYESAYNALKEMGFKGAAIDRTLARINAPTGTAEEMIALALKELGKK
ncbi:MAG: Holliday junction branch migration protein RuvA [Coprobacillus sp.]|nr:Holliday junction branch migration protein RuvA [Coprobacillus sp.]